MRKNSSRELATRKNIKFFAEKGTARRIKLSKNVILRLVIYFTLVLIIFQEVVKFKPTFYGYIFRNAA